MNEIILFEGQDVKLEVNMKDDTVWLNGNQMSKLFGRDYKTVRKHIVNALREELDYSCVANFAIVHKEGSRDVVRNVEFYNFDVINVVLFGMMIKEWKDNNFNLNANMIENNICQKDRLEKLNRIAKR